MIIFWAAQAIYDFVLLQSLSPRIHAGAGHYADAPGSLLLRYLIPAILAGAGI